MMRFLPYILCIFMLVGCSQQKGTSLSSSVSFDANPPNRGGAKTNDHLKAEIVPDGPYDKKVLIEGNATLPFLVTVGISQERSGASSYETAEILFRVKDGTLSPLGDWQMSGGGERPALRRESDKEIVVYYPTELDGERSWARFRIVMK